MSAPFQLVAGVQVPDLTGIHAGFSVRHTERGYHQLTVNVSAERLVDTALALARKVSEPGFLVLEVPAAPDGRSAAEDRPGYPAPLTSGSAASEGAGQTSAPRPPRWSDVHYLDGIDYAYFRELVETHRDLLIDDGEINFGFGSHTGYDEVFVGAYKVMTVFSEDSRKYIEALVELGYGMEDQIRTVWENLTPDQPGQRLGLSVDGRTARDLVAELEERGLYFSERRRDPPGESNATSR